MTMLDTSHTADHTLRMTPVERKAFPVRLSDEERGKLEAIARHLGTPAGIAVRYMINEMYREISKEAQKEKRPA